MIDLLIVLGRLGPPQTRHRERLSQITHARFSASKTKPTTTFVLSPLTGAQIDVDYWVGSLEGTPTAFVRLKIPLASATVGHNYMHAGLESICQEITCAGLLCRNVLTVLGFEPEEIARFRATTRIELAELTWHTATASLKALRSLQKRTKAVFDALGEASSRHDVSISDTDYREVNGKPGLLITSKPGDHYRQYRKVDQINSRTKTDRKRNYLAPQVMKYRPTLVHELDLHARNELLICGESLQAHGLDHPGKWTADAVRALVDACWQAMGLGSRQRQGDSTTLSPEANTTLERYLAGEDLSDLPAYTQTRHRDSILAATGHDIAIPIKLRKINPESVGYQLMYDRRWKPKGDLLKLVLCAETAPAIREELEHGLAFLETGEIPELSSEEERHTWLKRWATFRLREGGSNQ